MHPIRTLLRVVLPTLMVSSMILQLNSQEFVIGNGSLQDVTITTSDSQSDGMTTVSASGYLPNYNKSSRFLSQATLGYNYDDIEEVNLSGIEDWIDEQINMPVGYTLESAVINYHNYVRESLFASNGTLPENVNASIRYWEYAWWQYHMSQPDLLRQRIAFALSEIIVISTKSGFSNEPYAFSSYYDIFLKHAFGNYRDILQEVTYHPAMGSYLTYLANPKSDTLNNIFPDENYAREIMQLFTIGLDSLHLNGQPVYQFNGQDYSKVSTYDNETILEFSKIFTGLQFGDRDLTSNQFKKTGARNDTSWAVPMIMNNDFHEPGIKQLFNQQIVGNENSVDGNQDILLALDNLFAHPNVGPFISKLLIQRMVTSNPAPEYVARVASVFNDNGLGIKGDLAATVKAILLDPAASSCSLSDDISFGMMREPFIRYIHLSKAFNLQTPSGTHRNTMESVYDYVEQKPMNSPSVFNFFQQFYQPIGPLEDAELYAPEFQITNSQTIVGYLNGLNDWMVRDDPTDEKSLFTGESIPDGERATYDLSIEQALAANDDELHILVDRLDMLLAHGLLSDQSKNMIVEAIKKFPATDEDDIDERARIAIYLVLSSPEYLINR